MIPTAASTRPRRLVCARGLGPRHFVGPAPPIGWFHTWYAPPRLGPATRPRGCWRLVAADINLIKYPFLLVGTRFTGRHRTEPWLEGYNAGQVVSALFLLTAPPERANIVAG